MLHGFIAAVLSCAMAAHCHLTVGELVAFINDKPRSNGKMELTTMKCMSHSVLENDVQILHSSSDSGNSHGTQHQMKMPAKSDAAEATVTAANSSKQQHDE